MSGDYAVGDTIYMRFTSRDATGAPTTLSGTPSVAAYEDDSTTEITAGITLGVDHDTRTGLNLLTIVASGANGFESGKFYDLVITAGTVGGVSVVGEVVGRFSLEASAAAVDLANGTDGLGAIKADTAAVLVDTAEIGAAGAGLTAVPWNASWDAEVQSEVQDALVANGLDHLVAASVAGTDVVDDSIIAKLVSSAATADWDTYVNTTDALQAIRDRGDAAWTTGGGGSITDLLNIIPIIPPAIDLANTATWRLGFMLTNALDDLPSTAEITPGTVSIDRKAQGGTTWTAVRTDVACSEIAGMIYYDEVFSTGNGYAAGDVLRITFKNQSITVSANDYEITDGTTGRIFYSGILAVNPSVNLAQVNGSTTGIANLSTLLGTLNGSGQLTASSIANDILTAVKIQDGALTGAKQGTGFVTNIQSGLATASALTTVDTVVDAIKAVTDLLPDGGALTTLLNNVAAILTDTGTSLPADIAAVQATADAVEADTQNIQSRLPAALNNGVMPADVQRINDVEITGNGQPGTEFGV